MIPFFPLAAVDILTLDTGAGDSCSVTTFDPQLGEWSYQPTGHVSENS